MRTIFVIFAVLGFGCGTEVADDGFVPLMLNYFPERNDAFNSQPMSACFFGHGYASTLVVEVLGRADGISDDHCPDYRLNSTTNEIAVNVLSVVAGKFVSNETTVQVFRGGRTDDFAAAEPGNLRLISIGEFDGENFVMTQVEVEVVTDIARLTRPDRTVVDLPSTTEELRDDILKCPPVTSEKQIGCSVSVPCELTLENVRRSCGEFGP